MKKHIRRFVIPCTLTLFFTIVVAMIDRAALHPEQEDTVSGSSAASYPSGQQDTADGTDASQVSDSRVYERSGSSDTRISQTTDGKESAGSNTVGPDVDTGTGKSPVETAVEKKKIALTFDDGPDAEYTPMLLDGLAERGVKASFFVIGAAAEENPDIMKRMVEEGHLIGNHTYNHVDLKTMTQTAARKEIKKANDIIAKYTGEEPCFLRPPFGSASKKIEKEMEMIEVLWTIDTMDWSCKDEASICNTVYREIEENSIILMHDEYPTTVRSALSIIDNLQKDGYVFVTVDEILMD